MSSIAARPRELARSVGDSFAMGVLVMLLLNVIQRIVGLLRGIGFCHFLSDTELGQWALISSFLVICVPISVLGLPGSFGRFVEYFRSRGQFRSYLFRVTVVSLSGLLFTCCSILLLPEHFSWFLFRQSSPYMLVLWCVLTLLSVAMFSFVNELVSALREVRTVSLMQFLQSLVFATSGLAILSVSPTWSALLPSFTIACLVGLIPGLWVLYANYRGELLAETLPLEDQARSLWIRILPYAFALWVMNLLSNLFEVSDRYMLLHLMAGGQEVGQAMVGQYHCGRILPNLLTSVALMLGGILVPFMSADWEAGNLERITARLRQVMQSVTIGFMILSVAAMSAAPLLFQFAFGSRYHQAEGILPISLLQAIWASLFLVAESYLLCVERGRQLASLMIVGLACNLGLNWWMIQHYDLLGAVVATAMASLLMLMLLTWQMHRQGCALGWGTYGLCLAPLAVAGGPVLAATVVLAIVILASRSELLLSTEDRQQIDAAILPKLDRLGIRLNSLWPN